MVDQDNQLIYVAKYSKVKESIDFYELGTTSAFISKRSTNKNLFRTDSFPNDFQNFDGKEIYWSKSWSDGCLIEDDGIPFVVVGNEELECHYGPKGVESTSSDDRQESDHSYGNKKRRRLIQNTKKKGCPAVIKVKVVIKFPEYKVDGNLSIWKKKQLSKAIRTALASGTAEKEARFYLFFPDPDSHQFHLSGPFSGYNQPTAEKIRQKITELALLGVRKVSDVKLFLHTYVTKELFPGMVVSRFNRRYFPVDKNIRNQIATTLRKSRFSAGDQQNLKCMVDAMKAERPTESFFIRTTDQNDMSENDDSDDEVPCHQGFLFVHQSEWQRRLLSLYGKELCLLDATYNTSKYDLPLFFVCVQTNVGYIIVASFISANESKDSIREGLEVLKGWNPDWHPQYFMTDFDEREISAVEQTFEGCSVYLCLFHREQAWDRWLRELKNGLSDHKSEVLTMLRKIANSSSEEHYLNHLQELQESDLWKNNAKLQSWLGKKWIPNYHRWVFAFRKHLVNVRLTTTNGLERKHQDFKRNYLAHFGDGTLSTMVSVLITRFLQESYDNYITYNVKSLDLCRSYRSDVPCFLKNRPKMFVDHCLMRLPPNSSLVPSDHITAVENFEQTYSVQSVDSDANYVVSLDENGPSCQCIDWGKNHLPCKHMLAVFMSIPNWTWDSLPANFRDCPHFALDPIVSDVSYAASTPTSNEVTDDSSNEHLFVAEHIALEDVEGQERNEERPENLGRLLVRCSNILKDIQGTLYNINDEESFNSVLEDLEALYNKTSSLVPAEDNLPLNRSNQPLPRKKKPSKPTLKLPVRRKKFKNIIKAATKKTRNSNVEIEGTFGMEEPTVEIQVDDLGGNSSSAKDDLNSGQTSKGTQGTKRKSCLRDTHTYTKRQRKGSTSKKVRIADPVEQVHHFESSVNNDNLVFDVIGYRINQQSFDDLDTELPDEIMNAYISLKCRLTKDKKVHFIGCEIMTSIFTNTIDRNDPLPLHAYLNDINLEEYDIIIGAMNEGFHWTLMVIYPSRHEIVYLNPLGSSGRIRERILQNWILFLQERYNRGFGEAPNAQWEILNKKHRKQQDSNSCGVFVLKFAELILSGENDLMFDSSKRGLRCLRHQMGQYLVECSDSMDEVWTAKEILSQDADISNYVSVQDKEGSPSPDSSSTEASQPDISSTEASKNDCLTRLDEEDSDECDDEDDQLKPITKEVVMKNYLQIKEHLQGMMNCELNNCNEEHHQRHHEFVQKPTEVYNRERSTFNFGVDVVKQRAVQYLQMRLMKEMIYTVRDYKRPYTNKSNLLRNVYNKELVDIFKTYDLSSSYLYYIVYKEFLVALLVEKSASSYAEANTICKATETNMREARKSSRIFRQLLTK